MWWLNGSIPFFILTKKGEIIRERSSASLSLTNLTVREALIIIISLFCELDVYWNKDEGKLKLWVKNRIPDSRLFLLFY